MYIFYCYVFGEQGWRSGESPRLPPMWPGSIPGPGVLGVRCGLSSLLVLVLAPRGLELRYSGFPLSSKTSISKIQFDLDTVDEEPPCGLASGNSHLFYLFIYLF